MIESNYLEIIVIALIFSVTGLVEVIKTMNIIEERFLPFTSIIIGIVLSIGLGYSLNGLNNLFFYVVGGVVLGLAGSGLFDNVKKIVTEIIGGF